MGNLLKDTVAVVTGAGGRHWQRGGQSDGGAGRAGGG
jgi:hypothetical protein